MVGNCTALPVRPAGYLTMASIDRHVRFDRFEGI